jgi:tetratricopeptide (TPR) repeat protein
MLAQKAWVLALVLGGIAPAFPVQGIEAAPVVAQAGQDRKAEADQLLRDGVNDYTDGRGQAACQTLRRALAIYQAIQDRQGEATALLHLGKACSDDKEIDYYQKSLEIFRQIRNREGQAKALLHLGDYYSDLKEYSKAILFLEEALPIFNQLNDRANEQQVLVSLTTAIVLSGNTRLYEKLNFYTKRLEDLQKISQQPGDRPSNQSTELDIKLSQITPEGDALRDKETKRLLERGIQQYRDKDALDGGDKSWERALNIYRVIQDLRGEARLLMEMGDACGTLRRCRNAIYYYETAVPILQKLNDRGGEARALFSLANIYLPKDGTNVNRQEVEQAIVPLQKALAIYQQLKDKKSEAQMLLSLGLTYAVLSNYDQAIAYYNQALLIIQALKDPKSEVELLFRLGLAYDLQSKYPEAIRYYQQAVPIFLQIPASLNDGDIEGATMKNLGIIYESLSRNEESIEYYKKALSTYRKHKNRPGEVLVLVYLAKVYTRARQHDKAADCYELALAIYREYNTDQAYNTEIERILFSLGDSHMAMSQYQKAIRYYEELRAIYGSAI